MQEALDIYIKLLIAIISFIAPLLINLMSVFSDGIAVKKRKLNEFEVQTAKLLKDEINSAGADVAKLVRDNSTVFKKQADDSNKQLDLLDPKRQIVRIFPTFFYSLMLIMLNRLLADRHLASLINNELLCKLILLTFLSGSIYFAVKGVIILKRVVWAIIEVKQEIAQENEKEKQQAKTEKITLIEKGNK